MNYSRRLLSTCTCIKNWLFSLSLVCYTNLNSIHSILKRREIIDTVNILTTSLDSESELIKAYNLSNIAQLLQTVFWRARYHCWSLKFWALWLYTQSFLVGVRLTKECRGVHGGWKRGCACSLLQNVLNTIVLTKYLIIYNSHIINHCRSEIFTLSYRFIILQISQNLLAALFSLGNWPGKKLVWKSLLHLNLFQVV